MRPHKLVYLDRSGTKIDKAEISMMTIHNPYTKKLLEIANQDMASQHLGNAQKTQKTAKCNQKILQEFVKRNTSRKAKHPPIVVIGGTNGKGAAQQCLQASTNKEIIVQACSQTHIFKMNERISINNQPIEDQDLEHYTKRVITDPKTKELEFSGIITLIAWLYFHDQKVDVIIEEIGIGGRLDAVNSFAHDISIITSVGLDHTEKLGHTLEKIAMEKSGIVRNNQPFIIGEPDMPSKAVKFIKSKTGLVHQIDKDFQVSKNRSSLTFKSANEIITVPVTPFHEQSVACALQCALCLNTQLPINQQTMIQGITRTKLAGRMELICDKRQIWVDVAHNAPAIENLLLKWPFPMEITQCIVLLKKHKEIDKIIDIIMKHCPPTQIWLSKQLSSENVAPKELIDKMQLSIDHVIDLNKAPDALSNPKHKKIIFGSFAIVAKAKETFQNNEKQTEDQ